MDRDDLCRKLVDETGLNEGTVLRYLAGCSVRRSTRYMLERAQREISERAALERAEKTPPAPHEGSA